MSKFYAYYYIGNRLNGSSHDLNYQQPKILSFAKIQNEDPKHYSAHMHPHLEIFYFESGMGTLRVNNTEHKIGANDFIVINAKTVHEQYSSRETPLTYYCVSVDNLQIGALAKNCISSAPYNIHRFKNKNNSVYRCIQEILGELKTQKIGYLLQVQGIFNQILVDAFRMFDDSGEAEAPISEILVKNRNAAKVVKQYIDENYAQDITLSQLCSLVFMSKTALMSLFRNTYGISTMKYLTRVRLSHALSLLRDTDKSVMEISVSVGYNNATYFSELFMKYHRQTPTEYRKKQQKNNGEGKGKK